MKVLHVIPSVGPLRGGPSEVIRLITEGLAQTGVSVQVATTDDNGAGRLSVPLRVPVPQGNVTYWYFPRQTRYYILSTSLSTWLGRHVSEFDLLHIHTVFSYASTMAARIAWRRKVPYIIRPLGVLNRWGMQQLKPGLKRLSFALVEKRMLERAAAIHYTSEQERFEAEELGFRATPVIIPNPSRIGDIAPEQRRSSATSSEERRILFMSRLDEKKGLDLLIPAFARVRRSIPGSVLIIAGAGDPSLEKRLRQMADAESVSASIRWTGFVAGSEKQELLATSEVFVLPSYSENFGVAAVEAMAAGLPVVLSDQTGIHPTISEHRAGVVTRCNVEEISDALIRVLADRKLGREMGIQGQQVAASEFSVRAVAEKLASLYERILSRQPIAARELSHPAKCIRGS